MDRGAFDDAGNLIYTKAVWDNGTVGNYWSNYTQRYPNAHQVSNSGIWDTSYIINEKNTDHHPLVAPVSSDAALVLSQALISTHNPSPDSSTNNLIIAALITVAIIMLIIATALIMRKRQKPNLSPRTKTPSV